MPENEYQRADSNINANELINVIHDKPCDYIDLTEIKDEMLREALTMVWEYEWADVSSAIAWEQGYRYGREVGENAE